MIIEKLNGKQVTEIINKNIEHAIEATENSYRNKVFVVLRGEFIESFNKTKRGAEGYIKKHTFSYYDEYYMEMVEAGAGLYIVEVSSFDIIDYFNSPSIWFYTMKDRWSRRQTNEYILKQAEQIGVSENVSNVIKMILNESDSNSFPSYEMIFGNEAAQTESIDTVENVPESVDTKEVVNSITESENSVQMKLNNDKNGVELYFTDKPSEEVRNTLKMNGFRWSKYNKCWYAKQSEKTLSIAKQLSNGEMTTKENEAIQYKKVEFVDITEFTIPESVEKRLIDNSLINNGRYVGMYTKELQGTLTRLKEETEKVLSNTDDSYYHYKLITLFNSFCKRYTEAMNSYYYHSSINPSWAVTGRGGLNIDRYNKKQEQIHNKLGKTVEIVKNFESYLNKYDNKIKKEKKYKQQKAVNEAIENNTISLSFQTRKRTFDYYGYTYNTRSYESPNYFFMKMANCYRIFDKNTLKEVHSMKTTDNLDTTKKYVLYLESLKMEEVI